MDIKKRFETLRFMKSPIKDVLLNALEHVKHFIIKRKLILVGGMALDCNLRIKNLKLYDDDQIPDYDFYSPQNAEDAYLLGHELCAAEFPQVDVITAIHTTTMKVRVDGNVVADITYMPLEQFNTLKIQEFQGMRIIHPHYIMMDQFRSMSCPYENPPNEVIVCRGSKDIERHNILNRAYPVTALKAPKLPTKLHRVALNIPKDTVVNGWAALAYYQNLYKITSVLKYSEKEVSIPVDYLSLMSNNIKQFESDKGVKLYNARFSYPRYVRTKDAEIFDVFGERITVHEKNNNMISIVGLMFYFMHRWLLCHDNISLYAVIAIHKILDQYPQQLDVTPYGTVSWNTSTLYSIANIINYDRVKNWKPQPQTFPGDDCGIKRTFDHTQSPLFAIDESVSDKFEDIVDHDVLRLTKR